MALIGVLAPRARAPVDPAPGRGFGGADGRHVARRRLTSCRPSGRAVTSRGGLTHRAPPARPAGRPGRVEARNAPLRACPSARRRLSSAFRPRRSAGIGREAWRLAPDVLVQGPFRTRGVGGAPTRTWAGMVFPAPLGFAVGFFVEARGLDRPRRRSPPSRREWRQPSPRDRPAPGPAVRAPSAGVRAGCRARSARPPRRRG